MDAAQHWYDFFQNWPAALPRKGVAVTTFGEQIPFHTFLTSEKLLVLERQTPDTVGTRTVVVPYSNIMAVKMTEVVKTSAYAAMGFQGTLSGK